jgi:hypothetical protein
MSWENTARVSVGSLAFRVFEQACVNHRKLEQKMLKKINLFALTAALAVIFGGLTPHVSRAQSSMSMSAPMSPAASTEVIPSSTEITLVAKIKSIDTATRELVVVGKDGNAVTLEAGPAVRLQLLKKGDTITAKYYRSVAFAFSSPGAVVPPNQMAAVVARPVSAPGGVALRLTRISGLVVGVDLSSNSVEIVSPSGGAVHTVVVTDPARIALLPQLQVGTTVTAVVSETLAVSVQPAPKGLFGF